ncbi:MAG: hypothetical protein M3O32_00670 [Actinomycetota bacterium]|nr:hypothetical protein [Actinomycetota bacterium]
MTASSEALAVGLAMPALPRTKAVDALTQSLVDNGLTPESARVIARAASRPDDFRRRLAAPVELRVPGGVLLVVESPVWAHAVVPYPTNPRELGERVYPLALRTPAPPEQQLVEDPTPSTEEAAGLVLSVNSRAQLVTRLRDSENWLSHANPLDDDIGGEGVLQPLTLVAMRVDHADGTPSTAMLAAADGSSRCSAAHRLLGTDPADIPYALTDNDRAFRQAIGQVLRSAADDGWDELSNEEQRAFRVVSLPARVIVGYERAPGRSGAFDSAVRALIGLMHINPPRPYGAAVEHSAIADAVLDTLAAAGRARSFRLDGDQRRWFAATMTPREREAAGLPEHLDVRAADIVRCLLMGGRNTAIKVNSGIRAVTAERHPNMERRVDVAVELVLRPWLGQASALSRAQVQARRAALQRLFRLPQIAQQGSDLLLEGMPDSPWDLTELRDDAVASAASRSADGLSQSQVELAIKASYYLALAEPMGLRREAVGRRDDVAPSDNRALSVVLRAMVSSPRGCLQAHAVVVAGRAGEPLVEVDAKGKPVRTADGTARALTDERVRSTYGGAPAMSAATNGRAAAAARWAELVAAVADAADKTERLRAVLSAAGQPLLDTSGWPEVEVGPVRDTLDRVSRRLGGWGDIWAEQQALLDGEEQDD